MNFIWYDCIFFIFKNEFYQSYFKLILEKYLDQKNNINFERCLASACHLVLYEGNNWIPLTEYVIYQGYNDLINKLIEKNIFKIIKYFIFYYLKLYVNRQTI